MFTTTVLFEANYLSEEQITVNQGGTGSGKTYTILQTLFSKLGEQEKKVCTVAGQDIPNLRVGALRDALEIVDNNPPLQRLIKSYNKSTLMFTYHNGSVMEFKSYDSAQDAKSGKRDYLFINEANGIPYPVFKELYLRTRLQTYIDYNPNAEFWVHEHLLGKPNVKLLISDHRHNPFMPPHQRGIIEALKDEDEELWKVYARGLTGKIEGLILRNWEVIDELPEGVKAVGTGLDFGFTNDPTGILDVYKQGGALYLDELLYETGLTNPDIARRLNELNFNRSKEIIADSAEPKSIVELQRLGLKVSPAIKGADSILNGIDVLKRYKLYVTRRSTNLRKELSNYKWKVDRLSGKPMNVPVDIFNHLIDPLRYVATAKLALQPKAGFGYRKAKR
jgi:phage terminase large subunit